MVVVSQRQHEDWGALLRGGRNGVVEMGYQEGDDSWAIIYRRCDTVRGQQGPIYSVSIEVIQCLFMSKFVITKVQFRVVE